MAKKSKATIEAIQKQVAYLLKVVGEVKEFTLNSRVVGTLRLMDEAVQAGKVDDAARIGIDALKAGRAMFGAFIHNAVVDGMMGEKVERASRFSTALEKRRAAGFDLDLIARLESMGQGLRDAVTKEKGACFDLRVKAYNELAEAFVAVDTENERRERVRKAISAQAELTRMVVAATSSGTVVRNRVISDRQRATA